MEMMHAPISSGGSISYVNVPTSQDYLYPLAPPYEGRETDFPTDMYDSANECSLMEMGPGDHVYKTPRSLPGHYHSQSDLDPDAYRVNADASSQLLPPRNCLNGAPKGDGMYSGLLTGSADLSQSTLLSHQRDLNCNASKSTLVWWKQLSSIYSVKVQWTEFVRDVIWTEPSSCWQNREGGLSSLFLHYVDSSSHIYVLVCFLLVGFPSILRLLLFFFFFFSFLFFFFWEYWDGKFWHISLWRTYASQSDCSNNFHILGVVGCCSSSKT